jgi:transcriptional regulator with XRE-family HTH domain
MGSSNAKPTNAVKAWRIKAGISQEQLAEQTGMSHSNIGRIERGLVPLGEQHVPALARALGIEPSDLFRAPDLGHRQITAVPLVGYVGAGAEAHFYATGDEGLGEVDAPDGSTLQTRAAEVRGESLGPLFEHWLIYYDDVRTPVTPDLIGKLCIVGLPNDKVLVKKLRRSRMDGLFHLLSNNEEPMLDQEVLWAARVKQMMPR